MNDEERKAKRAAYMVQWKANLNAFIKEKRRLSYANNKEKLLANMAIYRENKKKESCYLKTKNKN